MATPISLFKTVKGVTPIKMGRRRTFVSGLFWQVLPSGQSYKEEARKIVRREKERTGQALDVVYLRHHSDVVQAGFIRRGGRGRARKGTVSLAAVAADTLGANFVAAFALPGGQYALAACLDEVIVPGMDLVCSPDVAKLRITELNQARAASGELQIFAPEALWPGAKPITLEELLGNVRRKHRLRQRSAWLATDLKAWLVWGVAAAVGAAAWTGWQMYQSKIQQEREAQRVRQLELLREQAGPGISETGLKRPWTNQPALHDFAQRCTQSIGQIPLTLDGWVLLNAQCGKSSTAATFARTEGRTVAGFADMARAWRDNLSVQFSTDGDLGTVVWKYVMQPAGDEAISPMEVRANSFMSWWQSRLVPFELTTISSSFAPSYQVVYETSKSANALPNWKTARWEIKSAQLNPVTLLDGFDPQGVRLQEVDLVFDADGQLKWTLKGELYGE